MHQKASSYIGHGAEKQNEERNREPDAPRGGNSGAAQDSRKQEPEENPAPEKKPGFHLYPADPADPALSGGNG